MESGIATTTPALRSSGGLARTGEDAYPTDRSKPAPSAHSSAVRKNAPLAYLTELFTATDATTLTKICELLEAAQPLNANPHIDSRDKIANAACHGAAIGAGADGSAASRTGAHSPCPTKPTTHSVVRITIRGRPDVVVRLGRSDPIFEGQLLHELLELALPFLQAHEFGVRARARMRL